MQNDPLVGIETGIKEKLRFINNLCIYLIENQ